MKSTTSPSLLIKIVADFRALVENLETKDRPWVQDAICVWMNRPDLDSEGTMAAKLGAVAYTEKLAFAIRRALKVRDADWSHLGMEPLIARYDAFCVANEGYDAFRSFPVVKQSMKRDNLHAMDKLQARVLARLVSLPPARDDTGWDEVRGRLRALGHLDRDGNPTVRREHFKGGEQE